MSTGPAGTTGPLEEIPAELLGQIGEALQGWNHLKQSVSERLPTELAYANAVRRKAFADLAHVGRRKSQAR